MVKIVSVTNQKGGVGKTVTVVNLAAALARCNKKVLVLDMDPQANTSDTLGLTSPYEAKINMYDILIDRAKIIGTSIQDTKENNVKLVSGHINLSGIEHELYRSVKAVIALKKKIDNYVMENFDFILIDCPPSLGLLTVNSLVASDTYIIPVQADSYYSLQGIELLQKTIQDIQENINEGLKLEGILITMYDSRTSISKAMAEEIKSFFGTKNVFKTIIHDNTAINQAIFNKMTIFEYEKRAPGAKDYMDLAKELLHEKEEIPGNSGDHTSAAQES
jgi:chromosome partitioning protein